MSSLSSTMRTMLITGGSRGIGAAVARQAATEGYDVAFSYRSDEAAARRVVAEIEAEGQRGLALQGDVAVEADVLRLFDAASARFGPLDAVIVNAGILHRRSRVEDLSAERLQEVMSVNVIGAFLTAREAARRMATDNGGRGGSIVLVSSAASRLGSANEFVDYAASKGAIDTLTIGLANELADRGVRVNAVRPGLIETDIHLSSGASDRVGELMGGVPMGRGGTAEETARPIMWLCSDDASYITGAHLDVTGGR